MTYQPHIPDEIHAYNEGIEAARKELSILMGKIITMEIRSTHQMIHHLNELDMRLMEIINE